MAKFDKSVRAQLKDWSDEDILDALEEARARLGKPVLPNFPKASMDHKGHLTISFQRKLDFPEYLKRQFAEEIKKENASHEGHEAP